jgi:hypothetical protein
LRVDGKGDRSTKIALAQKLPCLTYGVQSSTVTKS